MSEQGRLCGVLVTFLKPVALEATLGRLEAQTRQLDRLIVVDNGSSSEIREIVDRRVTAGQPVVYLDPGDNIGPAGGFALGMQELIRGAGDEDWIFLFDDDDPPYFDDAIENAAAFAIEMVRRDPGTAGVGISGGRFDSKRGRVVRVGDDEIAGPVPVDHITGGGLPAYRVRAVRRVGLPLADLFFGFEELEYGIRISREHRLYADGDRWKERKRVKRDAGLLPSESESARRSATPSLKLNASPWRRFYSLRNLVHLLRDSGHSWVALRVGVSRGLLKPLLNLPLAPAEGWKALTLGWRAVSDGWNGRLGRTLDPPPPDDGGAG